MFRFLCASFLAGVTGFGPGSVPDNSNSLIHEARYRHHRAARQEAKEFKIDKPFEGNPYWKCKSDGPAPLINFTATNDARAVGGIEKWEEGKVKMELLNAKYALRKGVLVVYTEGWVVQKQDPKEALGRSVWTRTPVFNLRWDKSNEWIGTMADTQAKFTCTDHRKSGVDDND